MKKFLFDILYCLLCFCIIWFAGEVLFDKYKGQNNYSYKYNFVRNNPNIKTLFMGHSHFAHGINPIIIGDSVFNLAVSGHGNWLGWDVQLAENLVPTIPNLKTIVYSLSYTHPYSSIHFRKHDAVIRELLYQNSKYMHAPYDVFPQNIYYNSALIFNKMGLNYWWNEEIDSLGYHPLDGQVENWKERHNTSRVSPHFVGNIADKSYKEYIDYFIQLSSICDKYNVRFIVLTTPCHDAYIQNTRSDFIYKMEAIIDSVRNHYPVEYKNYINDEEFRADSLYYNCSHLNSTGADKFSLRVKNDFEL